MRYENMTVFPATSMSVYSFGMSAASVSDLQACRGGDICWRSGHGDVVRRHSQDGLTGVLVELARATEFLANRPARRESLAAAAWSDAVERFMPSAYVRQLLQLYARLGVPVGHLFLALCTITF